jgi:hypothetical protein
VGQAVDPAIVVPDLNVVDAVRFLVYLVLVVGLPGHAIRSLAGLQPGCRLQRWTLTIVFGILWASLVYFALELLGQQRWYVAPVFLPVVPWAIAARAGWLADPRGTQAVRPRWTVADAAGLLLVIAFVGYYLVRTAACVEYDATGLRLYGAFFSDKMTNMSPCAALIHGVPPRNLRFDGAGFPYHYFPHLFVAAVWQATGIDYVDGFWFYAAALGIGVTGLAVLAFCRQMLPSGWLGCLGLLLFGLMQFTTEAKPLDLSIALLLLGLVAIDRFRSSGQRRWAALAVGLWGVMPLYEIFHAATLMAGLLVWSAVAFRQGRPEVRRRCAITGATCLGAVVMLELLCLGQKVVSPTEFVVKNSYRESYKGEWIDLLRESKDSHPILAELLYWKRGKPDFSSQDTETAVTPAKPSLWQRCVGVIVYDAGFVGYAFLRFVNLAIFGGIALAAAYRGKTRPWRTSDSLVAAIALVGFGIPCVVSWGHVANGQWWDTPNLYRPTTCAYLLLLLLGTEVMAKTIMGDRVGSATGPARSTVMCLGLNWPWRHPRHWLLLGLMAWQAWTLVTGALAPNTSFHLVDRDRLEALAFLRTKVPYGEVVIHPWVDDLIRNEPETVAWVYKRHFTLGSNLAGQQMYYEGREDHLFIGGFISGEEVYRRSRLRRKFYQSPDNATVEEVLGPGKVAWVVADADSPAPPQVTAGWEVAFRNATVRIYRRPSPNQPPLGNRARTDGLGRAITSAAISLPSPSTLALPASIAAVTADRSPLMITAMYPPPSFSLPTTSTLAALQAVSIASKTAVNPCVSIRPKANEFSCFIVGSSAAAGVADS